MTGEFGLIEVFVLILVFIASLTFFIPAWGISRWESKKQDEDDTKER
jgi:hypothetical protein